MSSHVWIWLVLTNRLAIESVEHYHFTNLYHIQNISSQYLSLVHLTRQATLMKCALSVLKHPQRMWFTYNKKNKECVTSDCWAMPVQAQEDTGNIYYFKQGQAIRSCSDVKKADPATGDGEYWIYTDAPTFLGCPSKIYCHGMESESPQEFVTLHTPNTGVYYHLTNLLCDGNTDMASERGTTNFSKIRINITTMVVDKEDYTFTSSTGGRIPYGQARDCYASAKVGGGCQAKGTFRIDTTGTGMAIDEQQKWTKFGHDAFLPSVTRSSDCRLINLRCGGACGGCTPGVLQLHRYLKEMCCPKKCPPNFVRHDTSCYWFSTTTGTYDSARSKCKLLGGDLAKITTKEEHDFIKSTATRAYYYVGATDLRLGGKWAWEGEATEIAYSDWTPGQPNGASEHCMDLMKRSNYKMNDALCGAKINFICEQPAKC